MPWHTGLTEGTPAYEIAASTNPRVRVVAGPGTGKSFAMKRRVARLLEGGAEPQSILPVTFTRVAAEDLHRELVNMNVDGCESLQGTTLHGLSLRILMRNHVLMATGRTARPLNDFELDPLVADLVAAHGGKREVKRLRQAYEAAWARLQSEQPGYAQTDEDAHFAQNLVAWLQFHRAMLIGEVIPQLYSYLRNNPAAPERSEFAHILVDEFQDLNKAEQGVVSLLSDEAHVCIVGDDDQSIYSFKHAHPEGILEWTEANEDAQDVALMECRRCPTRVVALANSLIAHNQMRPVPRQLTPMPANGLGDVRTYHYQTLDNEVNGVANLIADMVATGTPPGDILVLAQRGAIGTPIYQALKDRFVPTRSYYLEAELEVEDAQRRFSLLKLFVDRDDRVALRWLLGQFSSTWNSAGYRRVRARCEQTGESPWEILEQLTSGELHLPHTTNLVEAFVQIVAELAALEEANDLGDVVNTLFPEGDPTLEQLRALSLEALEQSGDDRAELLHALIQSIAKPEVPDEVEEVRIMSLHKSKGLSAPVTFVCGCVQGLLPKLPDPGTPAAQALEEMEEQRRLFFVAITRVKAVPQQGKVGTLILTYSTNMPLATALGAGIAPAHSAFGQATLHASAFLNELGPQAPVPIAVH